MSVDPDPVELTAPRDPAEYAKPRLMGPGFWAMMIFCLLCVAGGVALGLFGARLFPAKPKPAAVSAPLARPEAPAAEAPLAPTPTVPPGPSGSVELDRLSARIDTLEADQSRTAASAAAALAAASLLQAAQTSQPFADELATLDALAPPSAELRALRPLAASGAPSRSALAVEFPEYAARAAAAARAPGDGAGLWARIKSALSRVVMVRRVGQLPGQGTDALLARAESELNDGDVDHALRTLDALPPAARTAVEPWAARARARAEIDRRIAAVRSQALEDLARLTRRGA